MKSKKKLMVEEEIPEFRNSITSITAESKIFVDLSMNIAHTVHLLMEQQGLRQKDLAERLDKSEAEVSKILGGLQNLTLRTIAKLESALGEPIIHVPLTEGDLNGYSQRTVYTNFSSKRANQSSEPMNYSGDCVVRNLFEPSYSENEKGSDPKTKVC